MYIVCFAGLRSEEALIGKSARRHFLLIVVVEMQQYTCVTHVYQVSPPCTVWFVSLRSEKAVIERSAQGHFLLKVVMELHTV